MKSGAGAASSWRIVASREEGVCGFFVAAVGCSLDHTVPAQSHVVYAFLIGHCQRATHTNKNKNPSLHFHWNVIIIIGAVVLGAFFI